MREKLLATRIASYLRINYPDVIFRFDTFADAKVSIGQARRAKEIHGKFNKGYPDLFVAQTSKKYGGLYLELKATKSVPNTEHTRRQAVIHEVLKKAGYKASFCCGYEECIKKIKKYLH